MLHCVVNRLTLPMVLAFTLLALTTPTAAQTVFKAGTLAPDGSPWLNKWNDFVKDFEQSSPIPAKIVTYPGGVMGDESDMVRKLKLGQLQMVGVTVAGIAHVMPEVLVLNLPFLFDNYAEVDYVVDKLFPEFQKLAAKRGIYMVGMLDQGWIEAFSKHKVASPEAFVKQRVWIWNADKVAVQLTESLGINGMMLPVPEVLTSLQTGLVDSMFSSTTALVALQWHTQMKYYYPFKLRYDPAVFFITDKAIDKVAADKQAAFRAQIRTSFDRQFRPFAAELRKIERDLGQQIVDGGIQVVDWDVKQAEGIKQKAIETWDKLAAAGVYSPELLAQVKSALAEFRANQK